MKVCKLASSLTISALALTTKAQQPLADVHRVALCDVVRNPKEFAGLLIGVEASVVNDKGNSPMLTSYCTLAFVQ
jgi:hypothetical protein